jgi:hypothetical protein
MRWIIERLFGWDEVREHENFNQFFKLDEVRIIAADGQDVGRIQQQVEQPWLVLCNASDAAAGSGNAGPSAPAYKCKKSSKDNYPGRRKDQSRRSILREARVSNHA